MGYDNIYKFYIHPHQTYIRIYSVLSISIEGIYLHTSFCNILVMQSYFYFPANNITYNYKYINNNIIIVIPLHYTNIY